MPPMTCRLRLQPGMPVGLVTYPKETFLSLPSEVRNLIYGLVLSSSTPVTLVPSATQPPDALCSALSLGLLKVNKLVAAEAAAVFYSSNTFRVSRSDDNNIDCWDQLYSFLLCIGRKNRASLRYIETDIIRPLSVSIDEHGNSSSWVDGSAWLRVVEPRDHHVRIYPPSHEMELGRVVDAIPPAIQAVFRLLGSQGLRLQITFHLEFQALPELCAFSTDYHHTWSGEVPNYIEVMRKRFSTGKDGQSRVHVLWKGADYKERFLEVKEVLERNGWVVIQILDVANPPEERVPLPWEREPKVLFTLKRKLLRSWSRKSIAPGDYDPYS